MTYHFRRAGQVTVVGRPGVVDWFMVTDGERTLRSYVYCVYPIQRASYEFEVYEVGDDGMNNFRLLTCDCSRIIERPADCLRWMTRKLEG